MSTTTADHQDWKPSPRLLGLPVELLPEILKWLPWKDVLHVRETCTVLCDATKAKGIWAHLVNEHVLSKSLPPRLERPVAEHSSIELERLFLRWKGAELAWQDEDRGTHPARERFFYCEEPQCAHLVKGGRWYLTTDTDTGEVTCYDLDANIISGVMLIPPQADDCSFDGLNVALDVDEDSPVLSFTMAFSILDKGSEPNPNSDEPFHKYQAIHIWRVTCVFGDSGRATKLSATRVATIPVRPTLFVFYSLSLRGSHVAFVALDEVEHAIFVIVMDWESANTKPLPPLRVVCTCSDKGHVYLLPNGYLLLREIGTFTCFNYLAVKETTSLSNNALDQESNSLWVCEVAHCPIKTVMELFVGRDNIRAVVAGDMFLFALFITQDGSSIPTASGPAVVRIMPLPASGFIFDTRLALGYQQAVSFHNRSRLFQLMTYSLPVDRGPVGLHFSVPKSSLSELPLVFPRPLMDEDSGRVVILGRYPLASADLRAIVIDFSLFEESSR